MTAFSFFWLTILFIPDFYSRQCNHLRHIVAIDHAHQAILLVIRGTFTISEVLVDVAGFARPFCGGEAHSEMATMAERVWEVARPMVLDLLQKYPQYELVLIGHSLGAGVASLLNILLHDNEQALLQRENQVSTRTNIRCFAYACPPTFTPLDRIPEAVAACSHYIHGQDVVPFLSVDNIRHLFHRIRAVEQHPMSLTERLKLIGSDWTLGASTIPESLIQDVRNAQRNRLEVKPGAPLLMIPAAQTVWMKETTLVSDGASASPSKNEDEYEFLVCDSNSLAHTGIRLDTRMMSDHFPSRYEHAFHHLKGATFASSVFSDRSET
jgi:pimeloyl-ACP methyl ester carboxylesterase